MYVFFGLLDCFTDCFVDLRIDLQVGFQVVLRVFRCFAEQDGQSRAGLRLGGQCQGQSSTDCYGFSGFFTGFSGFSKGFRVVLRVFRGLRVFRHL